MHLCSNVVLGKLLPAGTVVRRNFSFGPTEKSCFNRVYRSVLDSALKRRHLLSDFLFSLAPVEPESRLLRAFSLSRNFIVELETHPINPVEYRFLTGGDLLRRTVDTPVASGYVVAAPYGTSMTA
jgi:hypothetical protein